MTGQQYKNALAFYNRMTARNNTELSNLELEFVSHIDEGVIKKTLVLTDTSGGSYASLAVKYGCTKSQAQHWITRNKKAATN